MMKLRCLALGYLAICGVSILHVQGEELSCEDGMAFFQSKTIIEHSSNNIVPSPIKPHAKIVAKLLEHQKGPVITSTHTSIFARMQHAIGGLIFGFLLIYFSMACLWFNEERNAKYEALADKGFQECREVTADEYDDKNTNWLVHVTGDTKSVEPVEDKQFDVKFASGVISLRTEIQIYRWVEVQKSEETEESDGFGGKTTVTRKWYEYNKEWTSDYNDGSNFDDRDYRGLNTNPSGSDIGTSRVMCGRVEFGNGFLLGEAEISQMPGGTATSLETKPILKAKGKGSASATLSSVLITSLDFTPSGDGYYCGKGKRDDPQLGDVQVTFYVLKDGPATVLALQAEGKEPRRGGFLPYRPIRRPCCPCMSLTEEQEKERLLAEAEKSKFDIGMAKVWNGCWWCCCCPCNILNICCTGLLLPELHHLWFSKTSKDECFESVRGTGVIMKWIFRIVGWALMFCGLNLVFEPFTRWLEVIPLGIGAFLSSIGSAVTSVFSLFVTLILATLIIAMGYSVYHPALGITVFIGLAVLIVGIVVLCNVCK